VAGLFRPRPFGQMSSFRGLGSVDSDAGWTLAARRGRRGIVADTSSGRSRFDLTTRLPRRERAARSGVASLGPPFACEPRDSRSPQSRILGSPRREPNLLVGGNGTSESACAIDFRTDESGWNG
jgi:hypothetical protein